MVTIRLARAGRRRRPFYRVVVTDHLGPRDGRHIEQLGFFNPVATGDEQRLRIDAARLDQWMAHGAQVSERVRKLAAEAAQAQSAEGEPTA